MTLNKWAIALCSLQLFGGLMVAAKGKLACVVSITALGMFAVFIAANILVFREDNYYCGQTVYGYSSWNFQYRMVISLWIIQPACCIMLCVYSCCCRKKRQNHPYNAAYTQNAAVY